MESVEALVDGIKEFEGGVVLVSHDARLIVDSECDVWVCEGADAVAAGGTGLRVEEKGFANYRRDVLASVLAAAAAEEKRALDKAAAARFRSAARMRKLEAMRKK
jgi:ATP-binding cassette subfamily F protein 1